LYSLVPDFAFLRRPVDQDERVMGRGRHLDLGSGRIAVACREHADHAAPVARRGRGEGNEPGPLAGRERAVASRLHLLHHLSPGMNPAEGADPPVISREGSATLVPRTSGGGSSRWLLSE